MSNIKIEFVFVTSNTEAELIKSALATKRAQLFKYAADFGMPHANTGVIAHGKKDGTIGGWNFHQFCLAEALTPTGRLAAHTTGEIAVISCYPATRAEIEVHGVTFKNVLPDWGTRLKVTALETRGYETKMVVEPMLSDVEQEELLYQLLGEVEKGEYLPEEMLSLIFRDN